MKVYQELWWKRIYKRRKEKTLFEVCEEIVADDTGHTDPLCQQLAKEILALRNEKKA